MRHLYLSVIVAIFAAIIVTTGSFAAEGDNNAPQNDLIKSFNRITMSGDIKVCFTQEDKLSVDVVADEQILPHVKWEVKGRMLYLSLDKEFARNRKAAKNKMPIEVRVSAPKLIAFYCTDGSVLKLMNGIDGAFLNVRIATGSTVEGRLDVKTVTITAAAGSTVKLPLKSETIKIYMASEANIMLSGECIDLSIRGSSGAQIDGTKLVARNVSFKLDTTSTAKLGMIINCLSGTADNGAMLWREDTFAAAK